MKPIKSLYLSYMGLTEPLLYSQTFAYLKGLSQKGIEIYILSFEKSRFYTRDNINKINQELKNLKIKWFSLKYHKSPQFLTKPLDMIKGILCATFIVIRYKIDIVHMRNTICAMMGIFAKVFLRKKMVFDLRGLMAEEYIDANLWKKNSCIYKTVDALERYFIRKADEVIVLTYKIRDLLLANFAIKNITVIPTCVDLTRFNLQEETSSKLKSRYSLNNKFVMIYVGSLGTWYMLHEMIGFYKELLRFDQTSKFFVLSQTEKRWIEQYIPQEIRENITIESANPNNIADSLNLADLGIFFIKPSLSKISSCPTKFGEYLACGLPVVINSGIGDTEEVVRSNRVGVVIEEFTTEEYKKKISQLKELLKEGESLRNRCRRIAEEYLSLEKGIEKYYQVYSRIKS